MEERMIDIHDLTARTLEKKIMSDAMHVICGHTPLFHSCVAVNWLWVLDRQKVRIVLT